MKTAQVALLFAAIALPAISNAFFFGITVTSTTGATLLAANAAAVGTIATVGIAGAALAGLAAAALSRPPPAPATTTVVRQPTKTYKTYHHRGRRAAPVIVEVTEQNTDAVYDMIFADLAKQKMVGCFQRLVCDIAASPNTFHQRNLPILEGVKLAEELELSPRGHAVSLQLREALESGSGHRNVEKCEVQYKCQFNGAVMDQIIDDMTIKNVV